MTKVLLMFGVLFFLLSGQAEAARPSAYARAKAQGRLYVHRPNYKLYRGAKRHHRSGWFRVPKLTHKAGGRSSRF